MEGGEREGLFMAGGRSQKRNPLDSGAFNFNAGNYALGETMVLSGNVVDFRQYQ